MAAKTELRTTTIRLPSRMYDQVKSVVEHQKKETSGSLSLNDFIVSAITAYLKMYERRKIDAAFADMAEDANYQEEAILLVEEFTVSDWEALRLEDRDLEGEFHELTGSSR